MSINKVLKNKDLHNSDIDLSVDEFSDLFTDVFEIFRAQPSFLLCEVDENYHVFSSHHFSDFKMMDDYAEELFHGGFSFCIMFIGANKFLNFSSNIY